MKLRSVSLANVRRFAGRRATIDAIGDGITVLAEPNEFGKSTFFDALHALFFERHRSRAKAVMALQPHSGSAPEVGADLDLPEGRFRIEKRWLGRPFARITDAAGRLIAQEDEAEAWIDRLSGGGLLGPSGLLWVRQGVLGLEPEGAGGAERDRLLASRRDLLSSVAGEIDMMTGGRRMDAVLARVTEALAPLATDRLRPKARGDWAVALDEAQALALREADLAARAAALSGALADRHQAEGQRRALDDPEAQAARQAALAEAQAAYAIATAHAARMTEAGQEARLADLAADAAARDLATLARQNEQVQTAEAAHLAALAERDRAAIAASAARTAEAEAAAQADAARGASGALRARLALAQQARAAQQAARDRSDLAARLARAEEFRRRHEAALARLATLAVTPKAVTAAEDATLALDRLRTRAEARAVTLAFDYDGPARASVEGQPVQAPLRLTRAAVIALPGLGRLTVDPGERADDDLPACLAAAEAALTRALAGCGAASLAEARAHLSAATAVREDAGRAGELLASVAPEGLEALRAALARAEASAAGAPDGGAAAEDPAALLPALDAADLAEAAALAAARAAHAAAATARERLAGAEAALSACVSALAAARAEAGDPALREPRAAAARAAVAETAARRAAARARLEALAAAAPDMDSAQARLDRAQSVIDRTAKERAELARRVAELDGFIRSEASLGLEEELAEIRGRRAAAEARAAHCEAEVRALARLRHALDEARRAARDAYFGPVTQELRPLLALLHDGADLRLDDRTLLPLALTRDGVDEGLEILSGGTREQIAILTRLAFARLYARRGQSVPVILDDALVHSDDARIEAMFTALHRIARDQQILVLTCRQRAFAALGGERATVRIETLA
ncbi:DNA repair exonuclease SbcCD ATPase subunit [Cereibacter ovatus]|uniref:DNA repair exonuclease SbcCD ATPase subunit n=1 Tax=Cereibacter ovatus TaxID=439529 RepID=A0A285CL19_9RHOB|nr:hypothetical protein [Cereibacter ovatus]SNX67713.1 DNA repair exonuclease SbcCD ATPase subunit [Cereibacter ovatus]